MTCMLCSCCARFALAPAGGLPPDKVVEDMDKALADAKRLIETYHDPEK